MFKHYSARLQLWPVCLPWPCIQELQHALHQLSCRAWLADPERHDAMGEGGLSLTWCTTCRISVEVMREGSEMS